MTKRLPVELANPDDAQFFDVGMDSRDYPPDVWDALCRELGLPMLNRNASPSTGVAVVTGIDVERGVLTMSGRFTAPGQHWGGGLVERVLPYEGGRPVRWVSRDELKAMYREPKLCGREWPLQRCER